VSKKLRAAVTGAGWPAWQHIKAYQWSSDVELVALCDSDAEKLKKTADQYCIPQRFTSFDEMLNSGKIDVVSICTPNFLHALMSINAMEKGIHVLCEKPMAITVSDGLKMLDVSRRTGMTLMVAHQQRFTAQAQYLKKLVSDGCLGEIYHIRATWVRRRGIPGLGGWFTQKEKSGGGALMDIGVHLIDLSMWLLDFPEPLQVVSSWGSRFGVHGKGASTGYPATNNEKNSLFDVDDYVFAQINLCGGASLQLECSWAGHIRGEEFNLEIWGDKGGARLFPLTIYTDHKGLPIDSAPVLPETNPFEAEINSFIDSVKKGTTLLCHPEQSIRTVELIEMIYKSGTPEKTEVLKAESAPI